MFYETVILFHFVNVFVIQNPVWFGIRSYAVHIMALVEHILSFYISLLFVFRCVWLDLMLLQMLLSFGSLFDIYMKYMVCMNVVVLWAPFTCQNTTKICFKSSSYGNCILWHATCDIYHFLSLVTYGLCYLFNIQTFWIK